MNQQIQQMTDRLFQGRTDEAMDKHELMDKARSIGIPDALIGHLDSLPNGRVSKQQVGEHLGQAEGSGVFQKIGGLF